MHCLSDETGNADFERGSAGSTLIREGRCHASQLAGIPPGLFPGVVYDEHALHLEHGDSLLFCADGLTEARNAKDEEFEIDRLQRVGMEKSEASPLGLLEHVFFAIGTFSRKTRAMGRHDRGGVSLRAEPSDG